MQAAYLGKKQPSSAGVIYDESKNNNDAQLVQSSCGKFDGNTKAEGNTEDLYSPDYVPFKIIFTNPTTTSQQFLISKYNIYAGDGLSFAIFVKNKQVEFSLSQNGSDETLYTINTILTDGEISTLEGAFEYGVLSGKLNGVDFSFNTIEYSIYLASTAKIELGGLQGSNSLKYTGQLIYAKLGNAEYNLAEGNGDTLYNTGTAGGDADLIGATLTDFWSAKQDVYHYNFLSGFDLYENGTAGEEIRVPIGAIVNQTGYSYTDTYKAGKWHNNAETKIQLPTGLKAVVDGDCPNPLGYAEFESNFNGANTAFSNTKEKEHKYLVFYDRVLTTEELLKIQKCLKTKEGEDVLTDGNGEPLTDENGLILTGA